MESQSIPSKSPETEGLIEAVFDQDAVFDRMSSQQFQKADETRFALAEFYEKYGAKEEDFAVLGTPNEYNNHPTFAVVFAGERGMSKFTEDRKEPEKNIETMFGPDYEKFMVKALGRVIDSREALSRGVTKQLAKNFPNIIETVWLTGERNWHSSGYSYAPVAFISKGSAQTYSASLTGLLDIQPVFRPGAIIL